MRNVLSLFFFGAFSALLSFFCITTFSLTDFSFNSNELHQFTKKIYSFDIKKSLHKKVFIRNIKIAPKRQLIVIATAAHFSCSLGKQPSTKESEIFTTISASIRREKKENFLTRFEEFLIMNGINLPIDSESHFCSFVLYCMSFAPLRCINIASII